MIIMINISKYKHYYELYYLLQKEFYNEVNSVYFLTNLLGKKICYYEHKDKTD